MLDFGLILIRKNSDHHKNKTQVMVLMFLYKMKQMNDISNFCMYFIIGNAMYTGYMVVISLKPTHLLRFTQTYGTPLSVSHNGSGGEPTSSGPVTR